MMTYNLTLAGLSVTVRTPWEMTISDRWVPFLTESAVHKADCTITVQPCPMLPQPLAGGLWHGTVYYEKGESRRVFHAQAVQTAPYALVEFAPNGNVTVSVLPAFADGFRTLSALFHYIEFEYWLLQHGGLLLHASLIQDRDRGMVFAGPSGVGKSTQAALWNRFQGAEILNGDRAVVRKTQSGWSAFGSPFAGTSGIYRNAQVPIAAIAVLRQATENRLHTLRGADALRHLYPEFSVHRFDERFAEQAVDLALDLIAQVPVYLLDCLPNEQAVQTLKEGISC